MSKETAAAQVKPVARPLSPHLQIYRWEITMFMSILHRASGAALALGAVFFTVWLMTTIKGGDGFLMFYSFAKSPAGILICFGWIFAFMLHFLNGMRHLVWDFGYGFEKTSAKAGAWAVLAGAFILTVLVWNYARGVL